MPTKLSSPDFNSLLQSIERTDPDATKLRLSRADLNEAELAAESFEVACLAKHLKSRTSGGRCVTVIKEEGKVYLPIS